MSRWPRSLLVLAAVGVASIAGCGGGDYPSKPNDICKKSAAKIKSLPQPKAIADLHVYFIQYQQVLSDATRQFKAIKPPSDKKTAYEGFLTGLDRELVVLRRATNTVSSNPKGALALLQQQSSLSRDVNTKAKTAGLTECAKPGKSG
jgi:hypothetical protein